MPCAGAWAAGPAWRRPFVSGSSGAAQAEAAPKPAAKEAAAAQQQQQPAAAAAPQGEERKGPFGLVREEIDCVTERLRRDIFTEIPALERAAEYFFQARQRQGRGSSVDSLGGRVGQEVHVAASGVHALRQVPPFAQPACGQLPLLTGRVLSVPLPAGGRGGQAAALHHAAADVISAGARSARLRGVAGLQVFVKSGLPA